MAPRASSCRRPGREVGAPGSHAAPVLSGGAMPGRFDRDTQVEPLGGGRYRARIDRGWWIVRGPNGGYVAAVLMRALQDGVGDRARRPRSLTVHFPRPPEEGPVAIETRVERRGRSVSFLSGRMSQGGRTVALALAAFGAPRPGPEIQHAAPPAAVPPERAKPLPRGPASIPLRDRFESLHALGFAPGSGSVEMISGGWIRPEEPRPADAALVTAVSDAWPPAIFARSRPGDPANPVPTVDLTVHFRASLPAPGVPEDAFLLAWFRTRTVREGFLEEDGEIYAPDGRLLAQSRQLAVLL